MSCTWPDTAPAYTTKIISSITEIITTKLIQAKLLSEDSVKKATNKHTDDTILWTPKNDHKSILKLEIIIPV